VDKIPKIGKQKSPVRDGTYRLIFEYAKDGIIIADENNNLLEANSSVCKMLGYTHDEFVDLHASDIITTDELTHINPAIGVIESKSGYHREWNIHRKDGSVFPAEVMATKLPDGRLLGIIRDITDRKLAEVTSNKLAAIVETSFDAIIGKDVNGVITSWNIGAEGIFGYTESEVIGTSIKRLIPEDRKSEEDQILERLRRGEKVEHFETQRLTKDNRLIDVSITISPIKDADGRVIGASKIARDITPQKIAETHLKRLSQIYSALSQCNQAIVRCTSENELFPKICQDAVTFGGLKMAWIGIADKEKNIVKPVASFGSGIEYLNGIEISLNPDSSTVATAVTTALSENRPYWIQDFQNDPATINWKERGARFGWGAAAILPLYRKGVAFGIFGIYSGDTNAFDESMQKLLIEMSTDISFALDNFDNSAARKQALEKINYQNTILKTQQETSLDAILVVGENEQILTYNQKFIELWGVSSQLIDAGLDTPILEFVAEQVVHQEDFVAKVHYLYAHQDEKSSDEVLLKDGRIIDRYSAPIIDASEKYIGRIWYFRDVTDSRRTQQSLQVSEREQRQLAQNLKTEQARLVAAQRIAKVGSWETDLVTMAVIWSDETYRIFETHPARFHPTHHGFLELVHPEDRATVDEAFFSSEEQRAECAIEHRVLLPDGRIKFVDENWQIFFDDKGKPARAIGTCQDITERKQAEARIKYLNRVYAVLSGINTLIVRARDYQELLDEACQIATEAGGFRMSMIVIVDKVTKLPAAITSKGKNAKLLKDIKDVLSSSEGMKNTIVSKAIRNKQAIISNDIQNDQRLLFGKAYAEAGVNSMVVLPLIISGDAVGVIALYATEIEFFHDDEMKLLTELADDIAYAIDHIDKQEQLNYLAYYDPLTGLANRNLFLERVGKLIRTPVRDGQRFAIGLIDLERFKNINDSLGRPAGDALLKQVAGWLMRFAHDANLLARIDADHFAFLVPEITVEGNLTGLFDKVAKAFLAHPFRVDNTELRLATKTGIALFPDDGADAETLFKNAEAALKYAKKGGDRYLFHTKEMTEAVAVKLTLENQLRQAIDNEEFVLHYQPKVNLSSGKVTGAEALIRWNNPRTGLVPPGKFIPVLEETGLISEVGRWALRKAIEDYLRWRAAGLDAVRIAVNVSSLQLRNPGFVAEIERKVGIGANAAEGLELEITESMIMEDVKSNVSSLRAIRDLGVHIAIDDFGTGYSSLGYLSKLPVDTLKIDRSFVIKMTADPEGLALVSTIINLAHALQLKVVAEGVETEEQSSLLRLLNCNEMQGFLFSKPVPADVFEAQFLVPLLGDA